MNATVVCAVICAILAIIMGIAGVLGWTRHFPGNSHIGIITAGTRKSLEAWERAHFVAGPFWLIGALAFVFAALFSYRGSWILAVIATLLGLVLLALGVGSGARFSALYDASSSAAADSGTDGSAGEDGDSQPATVRVDVDAVRKAAQRSRQDGSGTTA